VKIKGFPKYLTTFHHLSVSINNAKHFPFCRLTKLCYEVFPINKVQWQSCLCICLEANFQKCFCIDAYLHILQVFQCTILERHQQLCLKQMRTPSGCIDLHVWLIPLERVLYIFIFISSKQTAKILIKRKSTCKHGLTCMSIYCTKQSTAIENY